MREPPAPGTEITLADHGIARLGSEGEISFQRGHVIEIRGAIARVEWDGEERIRAIPWRNLRAYTRPREPSPDVWDRQVGELNHVDGIIALLRTLDKKDP